MTKPQEMAKRKVVPVLAMKAYKGGTAPFTLNLTLYEGEWSASCPSYFTPGNSPQYPLNSSWLQGPDSRCGHFGDNRNLLSLLESNPRAYSP